MSEKHRQAINHAVTLDEPARRDRHPTAAVPAFAWGRQEQLARQRPPLPRMPNGDPPTLVLWGAEDV